MTYVEAVYHDGVFRPLEQVNLQDQQRVRLSYETVERKAVDPNSFREWLERVQKRKDEFEKRMGLLPDSTPLIAEDRLR